MKHRQIVRATLSVHQICAEDFFGRSREPYLVAARMNCAVRLQSAGYAFADIGRFMKRSPSTILYYLNPDMRERKQSYYAKRWQEQGALKLLPEHIQAIVVEYAKAENITPRALVSEWIAERAQHEADSRRAAA
ncbi:hypothetical protein [Tardiphaga sp.]|uniref:hypothetical protein n=1 Tax=Tardiphaga sp. TaxID=1926292 RepID=UPI00261F03B9|nr:hypothetical protein [Tardiphaga sp.]MDB5620541.1 hypothetical protein [Tardiphaga sp.]